MAGSENEDQDQHDEEVEEEFDDDHEGHEGHEAESAGDPYDKERLDTAETGDVQAIDETEGGDAVEGEAVEGDAEGADGNGDDVAEEHVAEEDAAVEVEEDPTQQVAQEEEEDAEATQDGRPEEEDLADVSMITAEGDGAVETQVKGSGSTEAEPAASGDIPVESALEKLSADAAQQAPTNGEDSNQTVKEEGARALAEAQKVALQASAQNTSAAYGARSTRHPPVTPSGPLAHSMTDGPFRRSPSAPPTSCDVPVPTPNRLSILYADGTRRIVLDAAIVEHVQIHRKRGMIKVRIGGFKQAVHEKQVESLAKKTGEMKVAVPAGEGQKGDVAGKSESEAIPAPDNDETSETEKPKSPVTGILVRHVPCAC
jgi:20S proteasome subunit alpha 6